MIAGVFSALVLMVAIQRSIHYLYPLRPDLADPAVQQRIMMEAPPMALALVVVSYLIGTLLGAYVATKLSATLPRRQGWLVGGLMLVAAIMNLTAIPHPLWFSIASLAGIAAGGWLGAQWGAPRLPKPQSH